MSVYRRPSSNPFRDYEPRYGTMPELREALAEQQAENQRKARELRGREEARARNIGAVDLVCIDGIWQLPSP